MVSKVKKTNRLKIEDYLIIWREIVEEATKLPKL